MRQLKFCLAILGMFFLAGVLFAEEAPQEMHDFNFAGYEDGGQKKWEVNAESANILADEVKMKNIKGKAYGEEDNFDLEADKGTYNKSVGKLHLQDNVVGTSESGAKLVTDSLDWDAKKGLITTEDMIDIKKDNMQSTGKGAEADQNLKTIKLKEDVTVNIDREEGKTLNKTVITCDGPLDIDYQNETAIFNKNVVAVDEQGTMFADKMTVYFDTATKKIKKVVCSGSVKMENEQNSAYGETMTYDANSDKARVVGRPQLIFYSEKSQE